jgi:hypothetical protein
MSFVSFQDNIVYVFDFEPFLPPVRERKGINGKNDESDDDAESGPPGKWEKVYKEPFFPPVRERKGISGKNDEMMMQSPELMESRKKCTTRS